MNTQTQSAHTPTGLDWYATQDNHGRGRITGQTAKLLRDGYLKYAKTGYYDWVLTLSDKGRAALAVRS